MKRKQKNQLSQACLLGLLFFVLVSIFIFQPREVRALTGDYNKAINGTLAASEWNNLVNDFVAKSGSRLDGYFSINTATSSTYALDINGALRATSIEGSYTGFLNAANISSGQFGANAGFGNFSFPGNVGIGTSTANTRLQVYGSAKIGLHLAAAAKTLDVAGNFNFTTVPNPTNAEVQGMSLTNTGAGSIQAGKYYYAVMYATPEGDTGVTGLTYSGFPSITLGSDSQVTLSNIPISSDPRVTARKIYRSQAGIDGDYYYLYYIGTINNNTATTYVDNSPRSTAATDWIYNKNNTTAGVIYRNGAVFGRLGDFVTAFGNGAMGSLTSGSTAAAFGSSALALVTTGGSNQAFGHSALNSVTTGSNNVGMGYAAMLGNQTGSSNVALGNGALRNNFNYSYSYNTAVGSDALNSLNASNNYNVGVGMNAGVRAQGTGGVYLGYNAGGIATAATVGNYNTILGYSAGNNLGAGGSNIIIGNQVGVPNPALSGQINIANIIYGNGATTGNTPSASGKVGIGTTTPGATLDVNGLIKMRTALITANDDVVNKGYLDSALASTTAQIITQVSTSSFWQGSMAGNVYNSNAGNVGIGTTSPANKLDVYDGGVSVSRNLSATFNGAVPNAAQLRISDISNNNKILAIGYSSNIDSAFLQGNNVGIAYQNILINPLGGNVGIGTTAPSDKLDVNGGSRFRGRLDIDGGQKITGQYWGNGGYEYTYLQMYNPGNASINIGTKHNLGYISFESGNGSYIERMRITNTGNIGIGTTTPSTRLTVVGSGNYSIDAGNYRIGNVATPVSALDAVNKSYLDSAVGVAQTAFWNLNGSNLYASSTGWNVGIGTTNPETALQIGAGSGSTASSSILTIRGNTNDDVNIPKIRLRESTNGGESGFDISYYGLANRFAITSNDGFGSINERFSIDRGTGNIGIGTTNPGAKLEVVGSVLLPAAATIQFGTVWNTGTLDFKNGATTAVRIDVPNNRVVNNLGKYLTQSSSVSQFGTLDNYATTLITNNTERVRIDTAGNVGIGTTTPGTRLTVVGLGNYSIDAGNYRVGNVAAPVAALDAVNKSYLDSAINTSQTAFWNINGSNLYASSTSWNVGIGTTAPGYKLDVNGTVQITAGTLYGLILGDPSVATSRPRILQNSPAGIASFNTFQDNSVSKFSWGYGGAGTSPINSFFISRTSDFTSPDFLLTPTGSFGIGLNGNVGIGTTNPTARLYVNGTSIFNDVATFTQPVIVGAPVLSGHAATKNYVDSQISSSTGAIAFWGGSLAANVWSLNSGNVGIGTTNPGTPLAIQSTNHETLTLQRAASNVSWSVWEKFRLYNSSNSFVDYGYVGGGITTNTAGSHTGYLGFGVAQSGSLAEAMRLSSAGNLGIGTVNPNSRLHVYNTAANAEIDIQSLVGAGNHWGTYSNLSDNSYRIWGGSDYLTILRSGNVGIGTTAPGAYRLFVNGNTNVAGSVTASSFVGPLTGTINASNVSSGDFGASTGGGVYSFPSNLGVGTTNPSADVEVKGAGGTFVRASGVGRGDDIFGFEMIKNSGRWGEDARGFRIYRDQDLDDVRSNLLKIDATDRDGVIANILAINGDNRFVGIGTTDPANKLDIAGDARIVYPSLQLKLVDSDDSRTWGLNVNAGVFSIYDQNNSVSPLTISGVNPTGTLYLSSGNVGIGTTAPGAYRLKVAGDMAVTGTLQTQTGSDFAEEFSVTEDLSAGTVVVMSNEGHKSVKAASSAYDRTVVGIVSDNPSIIAGKVDSEKKVVVAMMGVVSVNVSNSNGHIYKGDLLTSADLAGYAMKASEFKPGTIIGKALEDLKGAKGQIKVLVNLQ